MKAGANIMPKQRAQISCRTVLVIVGSGFAIVGSVRAGGVSPLSGRIVSSEVDMDKKVTPRTCLFAEPKTVAIPKKS